VLLAGTSESCRLRGKLELVLPALFAAGRRLFGHAAIRELYPEYLFTMHCVIRASVPLLQAAAKQARSLPNDPVSQTLADYFASHVDEEQGHDEWLLEDLASIGVPPERVLTRPPSPTVAALVGSQYYWVRHVHPVALLGYIALLEGYPPLPSDIERLRVRTGYGPQAFRTLMLHAELDPAHGAELDEVVDSLRLSDEQRTVLGLSAMSSVQHLAAVVTELAESRPAA
jgi:hypothetical protein